MKIYELYQCDYSDDVTESYDSIGFFSTLFKAQLARENHIEGWRKEKNRDISAQMEIIVHELDPFD